MRVYGFVHAHTDVHAGAVWCVGQRTTCRSQFCPSVMRAGTLGSKSLNLQGHLVHLSSFSGGVFWGTHSWQNISHGLIVECIDGQGMYPALGNNQFFYARKGATGCALAAILHESVLFSPKQIPWERWEMGEKKKPTCLFQNRDKWVVNITIK